MVAELTALRDQIDEVDKALLSLLAKRLELVAEVGEVQSQYGLPIYVPEREAAMLASRREEAAALGVPPDLIEDVLRRVMRESYSSENDKGFKTLHPNLRPVVIVGGGGREHAIALKIKENPEVTALYAAPGNGGIGYDAHCVNIKATDVETMVGFAETEKFDYVVVAQDDPLALGMVDARQVMWGRAHIPSSRCTRQATREESIRACAMGQSAMVSRSAPAACSPRAPSR